jgi:uncharacterized protein (DUF2336 family)
MIVRRFLAWIETAPVPARAAATGALARAYLFSPMAAQERVEAEAALTFLLDDEAPDVRRALAEAFAHAEAAPRHLLMALAADQSDIAAIVLRGSSLITDAELIDRAATGDAHVQAAVALRPALSPPVAAALAEVGEPEALLALAGNPGAALPDFSLARMVERHGDDPRLREALLGRSDLPIAVRQSLMAAAATAAAAGPDGAAPRAEVAREATERATLALAAGCDPDALAELVSHLKTSGQLTPMLLLRALVTGELNLTLSALGALAGMPPRRAAALAAEPHGGGFAALFRKAGLPPALFVPFRAALETALAIIGREGIGPGPYLSRRIVTAAIAACAEAGHDGDSRLVLTLRRFEMEAVREEARIAARDMVAQRPAMLALAAVQQALLPDLRADEAEAA